MSIPDYPVSRYLDPRALAFLIVAFAAGLASALQVPTLSLYLTSEVQVRPVMVGLFFTGNAITGIVVSQCLARRSDRQGDRKSLIFQCLLSGAVASLLFAFSRNYFVLLFFGVLLASFGGTATPQMFALAREHADKTGRENVIFSSVMRAQISLAWVVGPPLAFALAMGYGFEVMYLFAALAFILCACIVKWYLPSMHKTPVASGTASKPEKPRRNRHDILLLFVACILMWSCNSLYLITMPLYVTQELHLSEKLAGGMISVAAGLEIPVMLIAGYYAKRFGKRRLMRVAVICGLFFYIGMLLIHHPLLLLGLQTLNAIFIGIVAGIGMIYFQDLMPGQAGAATTLFTNSSRAGWVVAGTLAGSVADIWNYYTVFWFALAMIIITLFCIWRVKETNVTA
ncbi:sugar efflux transporter [Enterobacteriaceae bacterium LUAb1]